MTISYPHPSLEVFSNEKEPNDVDVVCFQKWMGSPSTEITSLEEVYRFLRSCTLAEAPIHTCFSMLQKASSQGRGVPRERVNPEIHARVSLRIPRLMNSTISGQRILFQCFKRVQRNMSCGAMEVVPISLTLVFSLAVCMIVRTITHCASVEAYEIPDREYPGGVLSFPSVISNVDDAGTDFLGAFGQRDAASLPSNFQAVISASAHQSTSDQGIPFGSRSTSLHAANDLKDLGVQQLVDLSGMLTVKAPSIPSANADRRLHGAIQEAPLGEEQGTCPHEPFQHLTSPESEKRVAPDLRPSSKKNRPYSHVAENNLIIKWDMPCLGDLARKLEKIQHTLDKVERDEMEVPLFFKSGGAEVLSRDTGVHKVIQEPLVFRKGVFHQDRVNRQTPRQPSRSRLRGRSYALSILAGFLGAQVSYQPLGSSFGTLSTPLQAAQKRDIGCNSVCRSELERLFTSRTVETMQATFYPLFGVDILTFTNLKAIMQAKGVQDALLLEESLRSASAQVNSGERAKLAHAVQCIETLSLDRVGRLQGKATVSVLDNPLNDVEYIKQWHHMSRLSNYSLWSDIAWEEIPISAGSAEDEATVVGLIDSGCYKHEDYWTSEDDTRLWRNPGETDCNDNIDNDGNGYVDDCWGWDFITNTNNVFSDYTGHGTSLASLLVGKHNDGKGGAGVMKFGKVMCVRAATQGVIYLSTLVGAFDYILRNGARVSVHAYAFANLETNLKALFESAYEGDHLAVVSAGSQMCDLDAQAECMVYPAGYGALSTLVVGSSNLGGGACCGTNWGKKVVHVFAAGSRIYAGTCINHKDQERLNCNNCYAFVYGSSIAAGLAAGVAAMVWAYMRKVNPIGWSSSTDKESIRIKNALIRSSMPSARIAGACEANGVINMFRAMHYYDSVPPEEFVSKYKNYPTLFRWNFPPFFQNAGESALDLITPAAG